MIDLGFTASMYKAVNLFLLLLFMLRHSFGELQHTLHRYDLNFHFRS